MLDMLTKMFNLSWLIEAVYHWEVKRSVYASWELLCGGDISSSVQRL